MNFINDQFLKQELIKILLDTWYSKLILSVLDIWVLVTLHDIDFTAPEMAAPVQQKIWAKILI